MCTNLMDYTSSLLVDNQLRRDLTTYYMSPEFQTRSIVLRDTKFIDSRTNRVYAIIVDSLRTLKYLTDDETHPVLYLSRDLDVLKVLTDAFNANRWSAERLTKLSVNEFDYAYLRQRTLLNKRPVINASHHH